MKLTQEQKKAQEFLFSIYQKAWADSTFKQNLIDNPIETLNKFTGKVANFPKDKTLVVEDQTNENYIYLNIPIKPNYDNVELTDDQLEMVSGGEGIIVGGIILGGLALAYLDYKYDIF